VFSEHELFTHRDILIPHPYILVGDSAYPCLPQLITPFKRQTNQELSLHQHQFNRRISKARVVVKRAFGLLKARFRALGDTIEMNLEHCNDFVLAACLLHNYCIERNEPEFPVEMEVDELEEFQNTAHEALFRAVVSEGMTGPQRRNQLMNAVLTMGDPIQAHSIDLQAS